MIGSTKYTTKPEPKQKTISLNLLILFIVTCVILVIIFIPKWMENLKEKNIEKQQLLSK